MKTILMILLVAACSIGQSTSRHVQIRQTLKATTEKLRQQQTLEQRLMQLRIRHNLGLTVSSLVYTKMTLDEKDMVSNGGDVLLGERLAIVDKLSAEKERTGRRLEAALLAIGKRPRPVDRTYDENPYEHELSMPPGAPAGETAQTTAQGDRAITVPLVPVAAKEPDPISLKEALSAGPTIRVQGSIDRAATGRALYDSAARLLRQAGSSTNAKLAGTLRQRARARLGDAQFELGVAVSPEWDPNQKSVKLHALPEKVDGEREDQRSRRIEERSRVLARRESVLSSLFYFGKSEELLAEIAMAENQTNQASNHYNAAHTYFAEVQKADSPGDEGSNGGLGIWGRAARAASTVNDWQNSNGGWLPAGIHRFSETGAKSRAGGK